MVDKTDILELYRQHALSQDKYTYFLLGAAGVAIGFALQRTESADLSWWLLPAGLATASWALSFYAGCRRITSVQASIYANYAMLQLGHGSHPEQPQHPQHLQIAVSSTREAIQGHIDRAALYMRIQFSSLLLGAVLFIGWRVLELIRLSQGL